jgi:hypothetical protein
MDRLTERNTMTISLPNTIWLKLVADETTPADLAGYAGVRILLSETQAAAFPAEGVHDTFEVLGAHLYGYVRPGQDGYEWVMQSTPDPLVVAVTGIAGAQGWTNTAAGQVYVNLGRELLARGNSIAEVVYALTQLYNAARANV